MAAISPNDQRLEPTVPTHVDVSPAPSDEEVVAIMAAMEALWPRPVVVGDTPTRRRAGWRFSGRWWALPLPVRRNRPWH